jgi:hypothetical protein
MTTTQDALDLLQKYLVCPTAEGEIQLRGAIVELGKETTTTRAQPVPEAATPSTTEALPNTGPMPVPLRDPSGAIVVWACVVCKAAHVDREVADRCCRCAECKRHLPREDCRSWVHIECSEKRRDEELRRYYDPGAATGLGTDKCIPEREYRGPVFCEALDNQNDGYFNSIGELREWCADHGEEVPAWVRPTEREEHALDADAVLDSVLSDAHDGAFDAVSQAAVKSLQTLLDLWLKANPIPETYREDPLRSVLLESEEKPRHELELLSAETAAVLGASRRTRLVEEVRSAVEASRGDPGLFPSAELVLRLVDELEVASSDRADLAGNGGDAATKAFDAIATLCGCAAWDYPGQLVRDVAEAMRERQEQRAEIDRMKAAIKAVPHTKDCCGIDPGTETDADRGHYCECPRGKLLRLLGVRP